MEADEESWDEKGEDEDDEEGEDWFIGALEEEVDDGGEACEEEMCTDAVKSADGLGVSGEGGLVAEVFAVPWGVAVGVSGQIDVCHGIWANQIEELIDPVEEALAGWGDGVWGGRGFWSKGIEDVVGYAEPAGHEGAGDYASEVFGDQNFEG